MDRREWGKKIVIISLLFLFQRFIPETTVGPATLLHKGCAKGPYRNSTAGSGGWDCLGGGIVGGPPVTCGCFCA